MAKRKNVLLILSDQQRMDTISAYGMNDICKTPHIDQLAAEGMKFSNAYTPSAICAPARASVMTGLYPHKHGVVDNFTNIKEGTPLLGDCMRLFLRLRGQVARYPQQGAGGVRLRHRQALYGLRLSWQSGVSQPGIPRAARQQAELL